MDDNDLDEFLEDYNLSELVQAYKSANLEQDDHSPALGKVEKDLEKCSRYF